MLITASLGASQHMNASVVSILERYGWIVALLLIFAFYKVVLRVFFGAVSLAKKKSASSTSAGYC